MFIYHFVAPHFERTPVYVILVKRSSYAEVSSTDSVLSEYVDSLAALALLPACGSEEGSSEQEQAGGVLTTTRKHWWRQTRLNNSAPKVQLLQLKQWVNQKIT